MKIFNSPKAAFAVLLAAILLCTVIYAPSSKADITTHEVKLLMVYDTSYEAFMESYSITNPAERTRQMVLLAAIPFELQWDIDFDVTVQAYANVLGDDPALNCLSMYPLDESNAPVGRDSHIWNFNKACECYANSNHSQHHSNGSTYTNIAYNYIHNQVSQDPYDDLGIITAHKLCWKSSGNHYGIDGLGKVSNPGFILRGMKSMNTGSSDPNQFYNWLYTKYYFSHEISHNFGAHDGYHTPSTCSADCPCVMNTGFDSIVYVRDLWCSNCHLDFTPNTFD